MSLRNVQVDTLAIGDELLCGRISDTNSTFVAAKFLQMGVRLRRTTVIEDRIDVIKDTLTELSARADFVICFGGLGPTSDDLTAQAAAELLNCEIVEHPAARARIEELCRVRKRELTKQILKQAKYPGGTTPILNTVGLAVGFSMKLAKCTFYFFPGVPEEMKAMFSESALKDVAQAVLGSEEVLKWHRWKCIGVAESELQRHMDPIEAKLPSGMWLGYQTRFPENHLTLYSRCGRDADDKEAFGNWRAEIDKIVASWVYTEEDKELEQLVHEELKASGRRLVLVESCTGGLVAKRLTEIAGSSESFWGSFVSYQVDAKAKMLGVKLESPEHAVSRDASRWLAQAALQKSGCEFVAVITGYTGPGGGRFSEAGTDPVGTLYICVGDKNLEEFRISLIDLGRAKNQWAAATHLLSILYRALRASRK